MEQTFTISNNVNEDPRVDLQVIVTPKIEVKVEELAVPNAIFEALDSSSSGSIRDSPLLQRHVREKDLWVYYQHEYKR